MTTRNRMPGFVHPAAQVRAPLPPLPNISFSGGGAGGGGSLGTASPVLGTAMPVAPATYTVITSDADPTVDQLGYTCDSFLALPRSSAIEVVRSYFTGRGANPIVMVTLTDAIGRLVDRMTYDCNVAKIVGGLRQSVYNAQNQTATVQTQLNQKNSQLSSVQSQLATVQSQSSQKDSQISSLQSQISSLTSQIQAALPASVQQQIATLQSQLSDAQQKLASVGITPTGLIAGAVIGVAGTLIVEKVRK